MFSLFILLIKLMNHMLVHMDVTVQFVWTQFQTICHVLYCICRAITKCLYRYPWHLFLSLPSQHRACELLTSHVKLDEVMVFTREHEAIWGSDVSHSSDRRQDEWSDELQQRHLQAIVPLLQLKKNSSWQSDSFIIFYKYF